MATNLSAWSSDVITYSAEEMRQMKQVLSKIIIYSDWSLACIQTLLERRKKKAPHVRFFFNKKNGCRT